MKNYYSGCSLSPVAFIPYFLPFLTVGNEGLQVFYIIKRQNSNLKCGTFNHTVFNKEIVLYNQLKKVKNT